jgi:DNA polymerase elongation subunit (family B)
MDELYEKEVWLNMDFTSLYPTVMKKIIIDPKNKRILKIKKIKQKLHDTTSSS